MKLDITDAHFLELIKKGYSTDMVLLLSWINKNLSIEHITNGSVKAKAIYTAMVRKGLVSEEGKITKIGIDILDFISKKTNKKFEKTKVESTEFDKWWSIFPSNDRFKIKGRSFGPTRTFKAKKEDCRLRFNKMILDGEFTAQQIIDATEYDINLKKELSFKKNSNQLKFLQNSSTYLYQKTFSGFVELGKAKQIKQTTNLGSTDI